ncbi:MAG: ankyrin repeat domain-containing protein [Arcobacter sp.]|nr:ankyrin repeat domain-containing protein [Arcobacter sp.]
MEEYIRLQEEGADFNISNEFGITPLMSAARKGDVRLVKFLLKSVRNVNLEDKEGNTALYYAVESNSLEVVQVLFDHGAKISDFIYMHSISSNKKSIVKFFDSQDKNKTIFLK